MGLPTQLHFDNAVGGTANVVKYTENKELLNYTTRNIGTM